MIADLLDRAATATDLESATRALAEASAVIAESEARRDHALRHLRAGNLALGRAAVTGSLGLLADAQTHLERASAWYRTDGGDLHADAENLAYRILVATTGDPALEAIYGGSAEPYGFDEDDDPPHWEDFDGDEPHAGMIRQAVRSIAAGARDSAGMWRDAEWRYEQEQAA